MKPSSYIYNRHSFAITSEPATEPVTVSELKDFLRIDGTAEDSILGSYISAARKASENYTGRAFITQTRTLTLDWFPSGEFRANYLRGDIDGYAYIPESFSGDNSVDIPTKPLISVSSVVTYDTENTSSTFSSANYTVDTVGSRILLNYGQNWPSNLRRKASIVITYVCGYGAASAVPADIKMAIMQYAADMYNCRTICEMSCGCMGLLARYRNVAEFGL